MERNQTQKEQIIYLFYMNTLRNKTKYFIDET